MDGDANARISYGGIAAGIGGLIGLLGVSVGWWEYTLRTSGVSATVSIDGTEDWTGAVAMVASIAVFAFGGAFVLLSDKGIRRFCSFVIALGGVVLAAAAIAGTGRADEAIGTPGLITIVGPGAEIARGVSFGLYASVVGGIFGIAAAILANRQLSES